MEKEIRLSANLAPETGISPWTPAGFSSCVLNRVSNAIEASPVGGVIEVETWVSIPSDKALKTGELESAGFFEMKIRNVGQAIPPEALQKVFNPFLPQRPKAQASD